MDSIADLKGLTISEDYPYSPLPDSRCIRLLTIFPVTQDEEQNIISCSLQVFHPDLDLDLSFQALSYTWGDPTTNDDKVEDELKPCEININARKVAITRNLHDALWQLRSSGFNGHLWIDAICINQQDVKERSDQVNMMAEIYGKAREVIAWLGKSDENTSDIAQLISVLALVSDHTTFEPDNVKEGRVFFDGSKEETLAQFGLPKLSNSVWGFLKPFFGRRWFQRVWIIQEMVLARNIEVLCGPIIISWEDLWKTSSFLISVKWTKGLAKLNWILNPSNKLTSGFGESPTVINTLRIICGEECRRLRLQVGLNWMTGSKDIYQHPAALLYLVQGMIRGFKATDPRDQIFSLIGILNHTIPDSKRIIIADYTKTVQEVFYNVAKLILEGMESLLLLESIPLKKNVSALPSWVPDFTASYGLPFSLRHPSYSPFDAAKSSLSDKPGFIISDKALGLNGSQLDVVVDVGEKGYDIIAKGCFEDSAALALQLDQIYGPTGQSRVETLWRTLIADQSNDQHPAAPQIAEAFYAWLRFYLIKGFLFYPPQDPYKFFSDMPNMNKLSLSDLTEKMPRLDALAAEVELMSNLYQTDEASYKIRENMHRIKTEAFEIPFNSIGPSRRLFITRDGYLGLGPATLQQGDSIWLVSGAKSFIALRQASTEYNNHYRLIGESYVHGMMHGEALDLRKPEWSKLWLQ